MTEFVRYKEREGYLLNNVPADHMARLTFLAQNRNTSLTNVAGLALADRYGLPFEPSTRRNVTSSSNRVLFKLPPEVMVSVRHEAALRKVTIRTVMLDALSDAFGLQRPAPTHIDPARRPGRPRGL